MTTNPITGVQAIEDDDAEGEVNDIYMNIKRDFQMPAVPNMVKAVAASVPALKIHVGIVSLMEKNRSIPQSLYSMIFFTIAEHANCEYCAAGSEMACRTLGVDEDTLRSLAKDLGDVNPERVRSIIQFALKVSKDPQAVTREDYDAMREQGVTDEEIVEVVVIAAMCVYQDIVADALKVSVDEPIKQALAHRYKDETISDDPVS